MSKWLVYDGPTPKGEPSDELVLEHPDTGERVELPRVGDNRAADAREVSDELAAYVEANPVDHHKVSVSANQPKAPSDDKPDKKADS